MAKSSLLCADSPWLGVSLSLECCNLLCLHRQMLWWSVCLQKMLCFSIIAPSNFRPNMDFFHLDKRKKPTCLLPFSIGHTNYRKQTRNFVWPIECINGSGMVSNQLRLLYIIYSNQNVCEQSSADIDMALLGVVEMWQNYKLCMYTRFCMALCVLVRIYSF